MKQKLLLLILPILLFTATTEAQIKYWDFGGKDLGAGYDNAMPVEYLNALSAKLRNINWVDAGGVPAVNFADGTGYAPKAGYQNENGESVQSIYDATFDPVYASMSKFQVGSGKDDGNGGIYISGSSVYTKPNNLPDLDGTTNMGFMKDSNSDRIITINKDITRYDERVDLPDPVDLNEFAGCIQFTTPGEKRWDRSGGRGFSMTLAAGEYLTVVGSGQYTDIEGDGTRGFSTGTFQFATYGGTGVPVDITDAGTGSGSSTGPIDGTDTGDESVRVMEFQAVDAGPYILRNRGGKIRIYRMYVSSTSIKSSVEALLSVDDKNLKSQTQVRAVNNRIYVSNVNSQTEVKIYSITGALVKSFKTNEDTNFTFKSGLWIATVKNAEGEKSVKLLTR
ncbi:T9SS type A sorting domain-containing protein [Thalassobellus citreus]|uniref:T9SS type A sorting domain-containing protein n=1 Tax=Thalassobellus citreus TaxID=3367752 RepID=UPI0037A840D0